MTTSPEPLRICAKCKRTLPRSQFRKHKGYGDGWDSGCKRCANEDDRLRRLRRKAQKGHEPSAHELMTLAELESRRAKRLTAAVAELLAAAADVTAAAGQAMSRLSREVREHRDRQQRQLRELFGNHLSAAVRQQAEVAAILDDMTEEIEGVRGKVGAVSVAKARKP